MKILVFGASGMIGHKMMLRLIRAGHDVTGTLRHLVDNYTNEQLFSEVKVIDRLDVSDFAAVLKELKQLKPDVILNCVGITLRKPEIKDLEYCTKINSEFPHFLKKYAEENNSYLMHFSTDCVFSGAAEIYTEDSKPDAKDIYGRTKSLGEVSGQHCLTLRGSQLGSEVFGKSELFEWALQQKNKSVQGFSKVMYSGVTTSVMADLVADLIQMSKKLTGLYHVSSKPISKYDLLVKMNSVFKLNMTISPDFQKQSNKILDSKKIATEIGFHCPLWDEMIKQLQKDRLINTHLYGA